MRTAFLVVLIASAARADIAVTVESAWFDTEAKGGAVQYQVRTNLPDRAIFDFALESRFDSVQGPLTRAAVRGRGEVKGGECRGKLDGFPAAIPPGRYSLVVTVSGRQRDEVEESIGGQTRPVAERDVFVGAPTALVAAFRAEVERIGTDLGQIASITSKLNEWIALSNAGKLKEKAAEYTSWHESARREIDALIERAAIFHDKYPTHFPACYAAVNDVVLNLGDHESSLWRSAEGKTQGNDPEAMKVKSAAYVEKKLGELKFIFIWECAFSLADLPAQLAIQATPEAGLPGRDDWGPWRRDFDEALAAFEDLARRVAPGAHERKVSAAGVEGPMGPDDSKRQLNEKRAKAIGAAAESIQAAVAGLKALIGAADGAVGSEGQALPEGLRRQREAFLVEAEKVRGDLRTFYK